MVELLVLVVLDMLFKLIPLDGEEVVEVVIMAEILVTEQLVQVDRHTYQDTQDVLQ